MKTPRSVFPFILLTVMVWGAFWLVELGDLLGIFDDVGLYPLGHQVSVIALAWATGLWGIELGQDSERDR